MTDNSEVSAGDMFSVDEKLSILGKLERGFLEVIGDCTSKADIDHVSNSLDRLRWAADARSSALAKASAPLRTADDEDEVLREAFKISEFKEDPQVCSLNGSALSSCKP